MQHKKNLNDFIYNFEINSYVHMKGYLLNYYTNHFYFTKYLKSTILFFFIILSSKLHVLILLLGWKVSFYI